MRFQQCCIHFSRVLVGIPWSYCAEWAPSEKMPRKFIVGGNWKCNGDRASIKSLVSSLNEGDNLAGSGVEVVVAPPMLFGDYTRGISVGCFAG